MGRPAFTNASRRALDPERALAGLATLFALALLADRGPHRTTPASAPSRSSSRGSGGCRCLRGRAALAGLLAADVPVLREAILGGRLLNSLRRSRSSCA